MRDIEICKRCSSFLQMPSDSQWNNGRVEIYVCSLNLMATEWLTEKEYISRDACKECPYKLEQTIMTQKYKG